MKDFVELPVFQESNSDYDDLEARIKKFFLEHFYYPLLAELGIPKTTIQNAPHKNPLMDALYRQKVVFKHGRFGGTFSSSISKELRKIGAIYDAKTKTYQIREAMLPSDVKSVIAAADYTFMRKMAKIDKKLATIVPEELAEKFKCSDIFDKSLWKADVKFKENVKNIAVVPTLTPSQRKKVSDDWENNLKLPIKNFTEEQIKTLRKEIYEHVMGGGRHEQLISPIKLITDTFQKNHSKSLEKAKFLAKQETRLLMAKFKEVKYQDAGVHEYIWRCVHRPHDPTPLDHTLGNVRYSHGLLEGKIFRFDDPPITTNPGQSVRRNNPGTDYRCRCFARPIKRLKEA